MAVTPPSHDDLAQIAERYGFRLNAQDVEEFRAVITGALASYDAVERCTRRTSPEPPDRPYQWPADGRQRAGRLVRHRRDHGRRGRPAGRAPGRDQGQHRGRRAADDERLGDRRGVRAAAGRHGGRPGCSRPGRRSPARRSARTCASPAAATPRGPARCATPGTAPGRRAGRPAAAPRWSPPAHGRHGARRRPGRLGPDPQRVLRHRGAQAHARPGALHRRVPDREHPRPPRPDHPHRARRRAAARRAGRAGTGWTRGSAAEPRPTDYLAGLDAGVAGLRVARRARRGSASPACRSPSVDETVRAAIGTLRAAGAEVTRDQPAVAPRRAARLERHRHRRRRPAR